MRSKICEMCQKLLLGDSDVLTRHLGVIYFGKNVEDAVNDYQKKLRKKYLAVAALTVFLVVMALISALVSGGRITDIAKSDDGKTSIPVKAEASYKGQKIEAEGTLNVPERKLSDDEKMQILEDYARELYQIVPKDEKGVRRVTGNLSLPEADKKYGIEVEWESSDPVLISQTGDIDVTSLSGRSEEVALSAELSYEGAKKKVSFKVLLEDNPDLYEVSVKRRINDVAEAVCENEEDDVLRLPSDIGNDIKIVWNKRGEGSAVPFMVLGVILSAGIYLRRYKWAERSVLLYRQAVVLEFPAVIDKLILLLNSGLAVYSALMRISEDYENNGVYEGSVIGGEIADIGRRVKSTNSSVLEEWKAFSSRMESADMLRFCTILEDNINKGSELCVKLENESANLLEMRKKEVQRMIRMVDSKMMIPMMIMLFSLVVITISPVLAGF